MSDELGISFTGLKESVSWSIQQFARPRENRLAALKQYVGSHYSDGGAEKRVPTNFLELAVSIYTRQLAAQSPRVLVTAKNDSLKPYAMNAQIALNQIPDEIQLGETLRRAVKEALFSLGIVKIGIASNGVTMLGHDYGQSFVDIVSIDDYFLDMTAKSLGGIQYEGNDYWMQVDKARKRYNSDKIEPDPYTVIGEQGEERAESVAAAGGAKEYKDRTWVRDLWLPEQQKVLSYGVKSGELLGTVDWDGPETGPYHKLGYSDVPGNLLPLPPVSLWRDLHELANALFRKIGRQADGKKTVLAFRGGNDDAAAIIRNASDGDGINYTGEKPEAITVGGVDPQALATFLQTKDLFSYLAGNLDTMGGLAAGSDTVGQDKLMSEAASARLADMQEQTVGFTKGIFKSLAWYEWTDPVRKREIEKPVEGTNITLRRTWSAETRKGNFLDYNFGLDVYSMQNDTPAAKLQKIGAALERFLFPAIDMLSAQGGQIDLNELTNVISDLSNLPELKRIVTFQTPSEDEPVQAGGESRPSTKPSNTTRTYERVNRPGATRSGKDAALTTLLMGGNSQPSENASIGRPTS